MIELKDHKIVTACFPEGLASQLIETTKSSVQIFDDINKINRNAKIVFNFNGKEFFYKYKYDINIGIVIDKFIKENKLNLNEIYLGYNG